jgi:hypothetical protein
MMKIKSKLIGYLESLRFPWLLLLTAVLFLVSVFVPDAFATLATKARPIRKTSYAFNVLCHPSRALSLFVQNCRFTGNDTQLAFSHVCSC